EDRPVGLLVEVSLPAVAGGLVEPDGDRMPVLVGLRDDHRPAGTDSDRTPISAVGVPLTGQVSGAVRNRASSTHGGSPPTGVRVDGIGPSRSRGAAATGSRRSSRGKSEHRAVAGEAERRAPLPCRSDEEAGVRLISSELLCILLALGCARRSPLLAGLARVVVIAE